VGEGGSRGQRENGRVGWEGGYIAGPAFHVLCSLLSAHTQFHCPTTPSFDTLRPPPLRSPFSSPFPLIAHPHSGGKLLRRLSNFQKTISCVRVSPLAGPDSAAAPRLLAGSLDGHVKVRYGLIKSSILY
jgi:hypothetical protein